MLPLPNKARSAAKPADKSPQKPVIQTTPRGTTRRDDVVGRPPTPSSRNQYPRATQENRPWLRHRFAGSARPFAPLLNTHPGFAHRTGPFGGRTGRRSDTGTDVGLNPSSGDCEPSMQFRRQPQAPCKLPTPTAQLFASRHASSQLLATTTSRPDR